MTNFSKILNQMGGLYSEERHRYVASLAGFRLLVIDDLGIERNTEYALEQVYSIIDERYKTKLPMIVTTNLTVGQLRSPEDAAHARIYSRVLEMCTPVHVAGGDRRKAIGKEKKKKRKSRIWQKGCCWKGMDEMKNAEKAMEQTKRRILPQGTAERLIRYQKALEPAAVCRRKGKGGGC